MRKVGVENLTLTGGTEEKQREMSLYEWMEEREQRETVKRET